jgi:hypothetical protein
MARFRRQAREDVMRILMFMALAAFVLVTTTAMAAQRAAPKALAATPNAPGPARTAPATATKKLPPGRPTPNCYTPTPSAPTKTTVTGDYLCTGTMVVERGGRRLCLTCGIGPPDINGKCGGCKAGYTFSGWNKMCCKGTTPPLPVPK